MSILRMNMKLLKLSGIILSLSLFARFAYCQDYYPGAVTLYQGLRWTGAHWDMYIPKDRTFCVNFPNDALRKVSSINPNGICVVLFKESNCQGRGIRFEDFSYGYDDFGRIAFHDSASSIRAC